MVFNVTAIDDTKFYPLVAEYLIDKNLLHNINNEDMRPQSGIIEGIEDAEWTLKLFKRLIGFRESSRGYTEYSAESYYFEIRLEIKTKIPLKCEVSFEIASENESVIQQFHNTVNGSNTIGTREFLKYDDFVNKFKNHDKLFLRLKAQFSYILKEDQSIHGTTKFIQNNEWSKRLENHGEKDFKFIVGDESIEIHKFFLTLESSVFAAMFENNDFKETQTGEMIIKDFKFEIIKAVVDFCYGKDISKILKFAENAVELLMFADKYNMENLKATFEEYYCKKLTKGNVAYVLTAANKVNASTLKGKCIEFINSLSRIDKSSIVYGPLDEELRGLFI